MSGFPRLSFGIIVFNGEPFIRYNLRAIYPFAHQILVVEGASLASKQIATLDGHSTDSTLETLRDFKLNEDRENKLQIITRDGFWSEKDEQSKAYAERATGDYLWQIDIDEFFQPKDIEEIIKILQNQPSISGASIKQITFWGGFDYVTDGFYLRRGAGIYRRIFQWGPGYSYTNHRPPTVIDANGRDVSTINWLDAAELTSRKIFLYHYSLLFPKQVFEKCQYYASADWAKRVHANEWAQEVFLRLRKPFRVHNVYDHLSWLEFFRGHHPPQIQALRQDINSGKIQVELRQTSDIEKLLQSRLYRLSRTLLIFLFNIDSVIRPFLSRLIYRLTHPLKSFKNAFRKILALNKAQ